MSRFSSPFRTVNFLLADYLKLRLPTLSLSLYLGLGLILALSLAKASSTKDARKVEKSESSKNLRILTAIR